jgi:hypothetical protein
MPSYWTLGPNLADREKPFVARGPNGEREHFATFEEAKAWIDNHPHPRRWHCDTLRTCPNCVDPERLS